MADKLSTQITFSLNPVSEFSEINPLISKARVRIFYTGLNRNLTYITEEFAEKLLKTLPYTPVGGIWDSESEDFEDHGYRRNQFQAFGVVPENPNIQWEDHMDDDGVLRRYACCDIFLWTARYLAAKEIPGKAQSMELFIDSIEGEWKRDGATEYFEFTDGCFLGLTALGEYVEPCFEGAAFYNLNDTEKLISELKNYNFSATNELIGGTESMENEVIEQVLEDTPVVEEEVVAETVTSEFAEDGYVEKAPTVVTDEEPAAEAPAEVVEEVAEETPVEEVAEPKAEETVEEIVEEAEEEVTEEAEETTDDNSEENEENEEEEKEESENFALLNERISALEAEIEGYKSQIEELSSYKKSIETEQKNSLIDEYSEILTEEVVENFKNNIESYSLEALNEKIAVEVVKANKDSLFNKQNAPIVVTDINTNTEYRGAAKLMAKYFD